MLPARTFGTREFGEPWSQNNNERDWRAIEKKTGDKREWVRTRGDSITTPDAPIERNEILGKVSFIVRNGKCFAAKKELGRSERALATLLRRSETATRVIVGIHRLSRATA